MYEIFEKLLHDHGVTAYKVAKETGVTTATLTSWKQGKYTPKPEKLRKIADYFGVTMEYLTTGSEDNPSGKYYTNRQTAEVAQKIAGSKELRALFDAAQDVSSEDLEAVHNILLALKRKERGDFDT